MLAACLEVPDSENAWQIWAFNSKQQIDSIREAIQSTYGINLTEYVLYPFSPDNTWLTNNSTAHSDFTSVLGLQGHDLEDLDFKNRDEVAAWVNLAYQELYDASSALGI
jgi:hypothetical protein